MSVKNFLSSLILAYSASSCRVHTSQYSLESINDAAQGPSNTKVAAIYFPNWTKNPPRLIDIHKSINLIYLFAAKPTDSVSGKISYQLPGDGRGAAKNFKNDLKYVRDVQHRKVILSVGGAGQSMGFPDRNKSTTFVESVEQIYSDLGGFDGLDWDSYEGKQTPDTEELIWISLELKRRHPGFIITTPASAWRKTDKDFCLAMLKAGALDYAAPQYYSGPNLATVEYMKRSIPEWTALLGPEHVTIGFGIWNKPNYMSIQDAIQVWKWVMEKYPSIVGTFDWSYPIDEEQNFPYIYELLPIVNPPP